MASSLIAVGGAEARLQQRCFMWHWNVQPQERYFLILIHNNPRSAIEGAWLKGMGLIKGAADLLYNQKLIRPDGVFFRPCWLECKLPTGVQSPDQKRFQERVLQIGHNYKIFRSEEQFKEIISALQKGTAQPFG